MSSSYQFCSIVQKFGTVFYGTVSSILLLNTDLAVPPPTEPGFAWDIGTIEV